MKRLQSRARKRKILEVENEVLGKFMWECATEANATKKDVKKKKKDNKKKQKENENLKEENERVMQMVDDAEAVHENKRQAKGVEIEKLQVTEVEEEACTAITTKDDFSKETERENSKEC